MHASKRITFLAAGLWLAACLVGSIFPWDVVDRARLGMDEVHSVLSMADQTKAAERIFLVGSSPIVLGISAKEIERRTGVPTFNIGINDSAEFFDDYMGRILPHIRKGDIVVVSDPRWLDPLRLKLAPGCTERLAGNCLGWWFGTLPHLSLAGRFILGLHQSIGPTRIDRDAHGDNDALDPSRSHKPFDTMRPPAQIATADVKQMTQIVDELRRHDACPLLALGPVFVSEREEMSWNSQIGALQSAMSKSGYGRFLLADDVFKTDPADFLNSYEHPSAVGRRNWTNQVIARLTDHVLGPCISITAAD